MSAAFIVWLAATVVAFHAWQFVCVWLQAIVGRQVGGVPTEVSIGRGPAVLQFQRRGVQYLFRPFPLGGFTRFDNRLRDNYVERNNAASEAAQHGKRWEDVSVPGRMLTLLVGPCCATLLGVLCLAIPVILQRPQLKRDPAAPSDIKASAVPGLMQADATATAPGQIALTDRTSVEFLRCAATFQWRSLKGWGGYLGIFGTTASSATRDFGHFFSCLGAVFIVMGLFNLLPLPPLTGGEFLMMCFEITFGRPLPFSVKKRIIIAGFLVLLAFFLFLLALDLMWIESMR